jgi:hypothetical protein
MSLKDKAIERQHVMSEALINEFQPYAAGEAETWALELGKKVGFGARLGESFKESFGLKNVIKTDYGIFHRIPTKLGTVVAVMYYSGGINLPVDFAIKLDHNIPCAGYVRKGMGIIKPTAWVMDEGCDDFAEALNKMKGKHGSAKGKFVNYAKDWEVEVGVQKQQVPYIMQLIPSGDGDAIFVYKREIKIRAFNLKKSKFFVEEFMDLAGWLDETLAGLEVEGAPTSANMLIPTWTLLGYPETETLYEEKGTSVDW